MAIIEALGINSSVFIQFFLFIGTISFLSQVAFKQYAAALDLREQKTTGSEDAAAEINKNSIDLGHQYESRAREVSGQIKTIFDSYREEAGKEYESIVGKARAESQKIIENARAKVSLEVGEATKKLKEEVPAISQAISQKLIANDKRQL